MNDNDDKVVNIDDEFVSRKASEQFTSTQTKQAYEKAMESALDSLFVHSERDDPKMPREAEILNPNRIVEYTEDLAELKNIIEAALFVSTEPLTISNLQKLFLEGAIPSDMNIKSVLLRLSVESQNRGVELKQIAKGFRFQSKEKYATWIRRLYDNKPPKYSRAVLETLSIIAYKQPVTRGDIEDVRGVAVSSEIIKTLMQREWIREIGKKEVPGRPSLYGTTSKFLAYFNITGLSDLPALPDIRELSEIAKENEIDIPDLINENLSEEWRSKIDSINEGEVIDELPDVVNIDFDAILSNQNQIDDVKEGSIVDVENDINNDSNNVSS